MFIRSSPLTLVTISTFLLASGLLVVAAPIPMEREQQSRRPHGKSIVDRPQRSKKSGLIRIVHTDGKFDDKVNIALADRLYPYQAQHIVFNGIQDHKAAQADMHDFFEQTKQKDAELGLENHNSKKHYYSGGSPFMVQDEYSGQSVPEKMSHEDLFVQPEHGYYPPPPPRIHPLAALNTHLSRYSGKVAHIHQIAPAPKEDILFSSTAAKNNDINVSEFGHYLGYNSRQDSKSKKKASEDTQDFVTSLGANMESIHGPGVNTILTNSFHNLGGSHGATQDYDFLEHRFPPKHTKQVGEDEPFHKIQMEKASKEIKDVLNRTPAPYIGSNGELTQADVFRMRKNNPANDPTTIKLRKHNIAAAKKNRDMFPEKHNYYNRLNSVVAGFVEPCQAETCDANHLAVNWVAKQREKNGIRAFENVTVGKNIRMGRAGENDEVHGVSPIPHPQSKKEVTAVLKHFFPSPYDYKISDPDELNFLHQDLPHFSASSSGQH